MTCEALAARGPLWARLRDDEDQALPLWKAALIALALELLVPVVVFGVDWSFLPRFEEPLPTPVMSVRLEEPPPEVQPEPQPPRPEIRPQETPPKKIRKRKPAIPIELPRPLPNEVPSRIELPKPEPEPEPVPPKEEQKPEQVPEQPPPLPSVFRDVKPVRKVKPVYPREAEDQHIQGRVKVRLSVDLEGNVTDVQVLSADPAGVFEESVLTAVRQYKFKKDGTTYQADQEIVFKIDD
jgi:periplasmic protein TonB